MDPSQMSELRGWASRLEGSGESAELRAAARAIRLLADEVDRLRGELASRERPPEPPDKSPPGDGPRPSGGEAQRGERRRSWDSLKAAWSRWRRPDAAAADDEDPQARRRRELRRRRRRACGRLVFAVVVLCALVFAGLALAARISAPSLHATGPQPNAQLGPAGLRKLVFSIRPGPSEVGHARWTLDGADVTGRALVAGDTAVLSGRMLSDGPHRVRVSIDGGFLGSASSRTWRFTVDTTPPAIVAPSVVRVQWGRPLEITGRLEGGAQLALDGRQVLLRNGRFAVVLPRRPQWPVLLFARDRVGNAATKRVSVALVPRRPPRPVRAVHVTFYGWATSSLRGPVLRLIDEGKIDAVELDLKDESGTIGFAAPIPLGRQVGAVRSIYDLDAAVRLLHAKGVRVIGRLVCFRDRILAGAAWKAGRKDQVVQSADGGQYAGYRGFTNFANPVVRRYNIDVAVAAARAGVDEILYDYVRRPDGPVSSMVFPGLQGTPEQAIVRFLAETRASLKPYPNVFLGASVFGVAATRPLEVAQDVPHMAEHVDYIAPMVYPSHWAPGEYGLADPNSQPYDIVARSLRDFARHVRGRGARIVPWLQDFSLGVDYGPRQVRAQIRAARDMGIDEFLLWDPNVTYTSGALDASSRARPNAAGLPRPARVNELGLVPVLMHHQLLAKGGGSYDLKPAEFRAELELLWREGYVPVRAIDLVTGNLDVPRGKSPVVLTFDDSSNNQLSFLPDGRLSPTSAVGVLQAFARAHTGFRATGTFFVLREPFAGNGSTSAASLRWLVAHGFELGDHTKDHTVLRTVSSADVQRELVLGKRVITGALPGYRVQTMALPFGGYPREARLALRGTWRGQSYSHSGVFLVGAEPAPSPFGTKFDPANIPRIKTTHSWTGARDFTSLYWLDFLRRHPGLRYVSDGDARTISFPARKQQLLAPRFRVWAKPY